MYYGDLRQYWSNYSLTYTHVGFALMKILKLPMLLLFLGHQPTQDNLFLLIVRLLEKLSINILS